MNKISKRAFCPHCGNESPQELKHVQRCEWVEKPLAFDEELAIDRTYFVAACGTCDHILLYSHWGIDESEHDAQYFVGSHLEYPDPLTLHSPILPTSLQPIPVGVQSIYSEAVKVKRSSPNGFAVLVARALEAICKDKGAKPGSFHHMIEDLVAREKPILPGPIGEAARLLKRLRNVGAHDDPKTIKPNQVEAIDRCFRMVVEYLYVAPVMVEVLEKSLTEFETDGVIETDGNSPVN